MKTPFDTIIEKKIDEVVEPKQKPKTFKIIIYCIAILSTSLSIFFTGSAMSYSAPLPIAIIMSIVISAYIELAPQIGVRMYNHKVYAVVLFISILPPVMYSMGTTIQTMYTIQSVSVQNIQDKLLQNEKIQEENEYKIKERDRLLALKQKYTDELQNSSTGTWLERTTKARIAEIDEQLQSIELGTVMYERNDFYGFIANLFTIDRDTVEFIMMIIPAIFIDIISPVLFLSTALL